MMGQKILCPSANQPENDLIFTPDDLALNVITHYAPTGLILDPCRGNGAFYNQYPDHCQKDWCEITQGRDFFNYDVSTKVDWIITNPPWSLTRQFLERSVMFATNIVYLITINHLVTKARLRILQAHDFGIKEIYGVVQPKKDWPASGFQLSGVHLQKGYHGDCKFSGIFGK